MALVFTSASEFRGKGNRQVRQGPRAKGAGEYRSRSFEGLTPVQIARNRLVRELEKAPFNKISQKKRYDLADEMSRMEQLRFMNMTVLACALDFLREFRGEVTPETFTPANTRKYILTLLPTREQRKEKKLTEVDLELMEIRLQASILRYIFTIVQFRQNEREATRRKFESDIA
jgi:hypothetical protein